MRRPAGRRAPSWPDVVFTVTIPGNLAMIAWVLCADGLASGESGFGQLALFVTAVPVLLTALSVSTWVSLAAVGAGVTLESLNGDPFSAVLRLLPGAVGASRAVAWVAT